jgi:hypothetical protein
MASSKQAKRFVPQGKKFIASASNTRPRVTPENDVKTKDSDDSEEESSQQTNMCQSG